MFVNTFWALVPPLFAIALALITKEAYSSLFLGVVLGALLVTGFHPVAALDTVVNDGLVAAIADNAGIFLFLVLLGIIVALVNAAGGSAAFGRWAEKNIHTRVGAMLATFVLGILIFIDDYFNCLTVGSVMRPVTDSHRISRPKLAYIIDATAAPVCIIAPISSWAAAVSSYAAEGEGLSLFVRTIPYNLYALLTIVMVIAISVMHVDFGPMRKHERNAANGDLFTSGEETEISDEEAAAVGKGKGRVIDLVLPVVVLIISCVVGMIYTGGFFSGEGVSFVQAFSDSDASVGLVLGSFVALIFTLLLYVPRKVVSFKECMKTIPQGFTAMVPSIIILIFAWTLGGFCKSYLGAGDFVANWITESGFSASVLPPIMFAVALGLAFATGTSWGTFGILIPISLDIFAKANITGSATTVVIAACLAGAVCGDHCSPISDTTIMASAGAQCNHIVHVNTQLPYALTVASVSFVAYIVAPFVGSPWISLPVACALMVATLFAMRMILGRKA
jgi:Na+/H+ antiporter NhaC